MIDLLNLDALLARPDIARSGLSSLAEMSSACRREIKRRVRRGDLREVPDTVWPRHVRWFK